MLTDNLDLVGQHVRLTRSIRDIGGVSHSRAEVLKIIQQQISLGRLLYKVKFPDGSSSYCFGEELELINETANE
jgi:hypothetical protein